MDNKDLLKELKEHYNNMIKYQQSEKCIDKSYIKGKIDGLSMAIDRLEDEENSIPLF